MNRLMKVAFGCHLVVALVLIWVGLVYLFRPDFMPYHADAVERSWGEVEPAFQTLTLALMRVVGGGFIAAAIAIVGLLWIPYRRGEKWSLWAIAAVGICVWASALYASISVTKDTPATGPWSTALFCIVLLLVGLGLSLYAGATRAR